jgi:hypothetical protein
MRKETEDGILADLITRNRPSLLVDASIHSGEPESIESVGRPSEGAFTFIKL